MSLFRELALAKGFSGGGGNPNRVQTITRTMATLADDMIEHISITPPEFFAAIGDNIANATLTVDATAIGSERGDLPVMRIGSDQIYAASVAAHWNNSGVYFDAAVFFIIGRYLDPVQDPLRRRDLVGTHDQEFLL